MNFRRATNTDFEEYARLYYDCDAEVLYRNSERVDPQKQCEAIRWFGLDSMDDSTRKQIEDSYKRTPEKFNADLEKDYVRIIMIEDGQNIIGFIELFEIKRFAWKIGYLCLEKGYQTINVLQCIVRHLSEKEKMRQLDVCTIGGKINCMLLEAGFQQSLSQCYLRWKKHC